MTVLSWLMLAGLQAAPADPAALPAWMAGYWLSCEQGREVSETWSDPRGSTMIGQSVTLTRGRTAFEFARIVADADGLAFIAQPGGVAPTTFRAAVVGPDRIVFSNPDHEPQRVIYRRDGERLIGRIEGNRADGPVAMEWRYDRAELNSRCPS